GDSQKNPLIAVVVRIVHGNSAIFLLHERPAFINADLFGLNVSQFTVKNDGCFDSCDPQNLENGFRVDLGDSRGSANAATLSQTRKNLIDGIGGNVQSRTGLFALRECLTTARAF